MHTFSNAVDTLGNNLSTRFSSLLMPLFSAKNTGWTQKTAPSWTVSFVEYTECTRAHLKHLAATSVHWVLGAKPSSSDVTSVCQILGNLSSIPSKAVIFLTPTSTNKHQVFSKVKWHYFSIQPFLNLWASVKKKKRKNCSILLCFFLICHWWSFEYCAPKSIFPINTLVLIARYA